MGASSGRVLLFPGSAVAGAHYSAFVAPALAYSHTSQCGVRQAAVIFGELEPGSGFPRRITGAKAKVSIKLVRLNQLTGVHLPVGIPCSLELSESPHQFRSKHFGQ